MLIIYTVQIFVRCSIYSYLISTASFPTPPKTCRAEKKNCHSLKYLQVINAILTLTKFTFYEGLIDKGFIHVSTSLTYQEIHRIFSLRRRHPS